MDRSWAPTSAAAFHALVSVLPRVWHDPRTAMRERKRMLRLLIEDVSLLRGDHTIRKRIRWKGGATTSLELPGPWAPELRRTPGAIVEMIHALATEQTDHQIADTLNGRWLAAVQHRPLLHPAARSNTPGRG